MMKRIKLKRNDKGLLVLLLCRTYNPEQFYVSKWDLFRYLAWYHFLRLTLREPLQDHKTFFDYDTCDMIWGDRETIITVSIELQEGSDIREVKDQLMRFGMRYDRKAISMLKEVVSDCWHTTVITWENGTFHYV